MMPISEADLIEIAARLPPGVERYIRACAAEWLPYFESVRELTYAHAREFYEVTRNLPGNGWGLPERAVLGLVDRYYLLTHILGRMDMLHHGEPGEAEPPGNQWLYERCREVEAAPDDALDLWARDHYKSTIITFGGVFQEILRDPDITIAIFSHTRPVAKKFLRVVKTTMESHEPAKLVYADVLWADPKGESPKWSEDEGIVVRRVANPKEATLEAWGLVDGMPTGGHYKLRVYDDVVTERSVTTPEMVQATTEKWELSDNLGSKGGRRWHIGTRYSFGDTYQAIIDRKSLRERIYPATHNGLRTGRPVFLAPAELARKLRDQPSQFPAQMLLNPAAGETAMFQASWLKSYELRPERMHVYILGDPSKGRNAKSDNTAIIVIGVDHRQNKFLLDGFRHRMNLATRWMLLRNLHKRWSAAPGVDMVRVGWESYGLQIDTEHFKLMMELEKYAFPIEEVSWTKDNTTSKEDRVERLVPDIKGSRFWFPLVVRENGVNCWWRVEDDKVKVTPLPDQEQGPKNHREARGTWREPRIVGPIAKLDSDRKVYDLTLAVMTELVYFPFGRYKDAVDAMSRVYDLDPSGPTIFTEADLEPAAYIDS